MTKNVTENQTSTAAPLTRRQLRALAAKTESAAPSRKRRTLAVAAGVSLVLVGSSVALLDRGDNLAERAQTPSAQAAAGADTLALQGDRASQMASRSLERAPLNNDIASDVTAPLTIGSSQVETITEDEVEVLEHTSTKENDPSLERGKEKVATEGKDGSVRRTYSVNKVDGEEVSRVLIAEVRTEPTTEVIKVGTKAPAPRYTAPAPSSEGGEPVVVNRGGAQGIAQQMVAARGWNNQQFQCLVTLWNHESGWRVNATNRSSGAYGIPQALPGSKMASAGADWRTNPATQIKWGLGYIAGRYGTPCGALSHFHSRGWY